MPVEVDATAKGVSSNSYVTVAEADAYFGDRLRSTDWTGATPDDKARALIGATARLEQEIYEGTKTTLEQALKWPRFGADDDDGNVFDHDTIPAIVKEATFEQALLELAADLTADTGLEGFEKIVVGPLEVIPRHAQAAGDLSENVKRILRPVLETPSGANIRLLRA